ncbi:MAG: MarR family transcriptional regulator [Wenzhouxiangellaceae bacterium]
MTESDDITHDILAAIRKIIRAIDLNSKQLVRAHNITGPQLLALRAASHLGPVGITQLARAINLSQSTVTGIVQRLEQHGLIERQRSARDRRSMSCNITAAGQEVLANTPVLLEDRFRRELQRLADWEQTQMLSTLQRIAAMMEADSLAAAPVLATESLSSSSEPDG